MGKSSASCNSLLDYWHKLMGGTKWGYLAFLKRQKMKESQKTK